LEKAVAFEVAKHQLDACVQSLKRQKFEIIPTIVGGTQQFTVRALGAKQRTFIKPPEPRREIAIVDVSAVKPSIPKVRRKSVAGEIVQMLHGGRTTDYISKKLGVSKQHIYNAMYHWKKTAKARRNRIAPSTVPPVRVKDHTVHTRISGKDIPDAIPANFNGNGNGKHKSVNRIHKIFAKKELVAK
jgi:hypothetical protein